MTTKLNPKTSYIGTCQACFAHQVIKATRGRADHLMVLHGYLRPGFGYIKGTCMGVSEQPYELSCEATKRWKAQCEANLVGRRADLAKFEADLIEEYFANVPDRDFQPRWGETQRTKLVTLVRGAKYQDEKYGETWTFEGQRQRAIKAAKRDIKELEATIVFLGERIASWKYAPEALKDHETVKREARAARDEEKLAAGFRRNWKQAWKYVADSINEHKRSTDHVEETRRWATGDRIDYLDRVVESHNKKWGHLPPFPTAKERAAARKGVK